MCVQYVWSGEPVIQFEGFDGQVTDIQMWDYPLSYREVFKYMTNGVYGYVCVCVCFRCETVVLLS